MTDNEQNYNGGIAPLRNVAALTTLVNRVVNRDIGLPGMGCFYGPSGYGKSQAALFATIQSGAVTVQMKSSWTKKKLCQTILEEMSVPAASTVADMVDQICRHLAESDRPLLIDEADYLIQRNMIEIARDIYEGSQSAVILIGEELLPQKLKQWERVHGRMMDWVAAQPGNLSDVKHLMPYYAAGVEIADDLAEKLLADSNGSIRRICVNLAQVRAHAMRSGLQTVDLAAWGNKAFFTGEAPLARSFTAGRRAS